MSYRPHPFDQITPDEIRNATLIIQNSQGPMKLPLGNGDQMIYNSMINLEPRKEMLIPYLRNGSDLSGFPRKSLVVVEIRNSISYTSKAVQYIVNHRTGTIEKLIAGGDRQVSLTADDISESERISKADPEVRRRLAAEYNVTDLSKVTADVWTFGYNGEGPDDAPYNKRRVVNVYFYFRRDSDLDNTYAHPVGFQALIDLVQKKVLKLKDLPIHSDFDTDQKNNFEIPDKKDNYLPELLNKKYYRTDIKPYVVTQPEGPSYTVKNKYEINWQKWKFRISFNYRTGLVFHYITYDAWEKMPGVDGDEERGRDVNFKLKMVTREVLYQMGLSEMVVPYGDPRPPYHRKSAFDMGEYGMGLNTNSLELGCDCIGDVTYFDFDYCDQMGNVNTIKKAVCLHEEDAGLLQKHTEFRTNKAFLVRSRRLVLSFIATVTNYEYLFYWYFYQDGTISHEIKASGELSTNLLVGKSYTDWGTVEFPLINAQYHQHIFSMRLDFMVDGTTNTAAMLDVIPEEGGRGSRTNPYANGFKVKKTVFRTAKEAMTDTDAKRSRVWIVMNENKINEYSKTPVAWKIIPGTGAFAGLLAGDTSYIRQRAGFAAHSFWAVPYKEDELYASGFYINQSQGNEGLEQWANRNESIKNRDIVVYHTFGLTHIPRVEDFPIMPVEGCGFTLKPYNYFNQNPGLDVPPPDKCYKLSSTRGERSALKDEICEECWWGERRTAANITCKHRDLFLEKSK